MKYGEVTFGQVEALINKMGGMDAFLSVLRGTAKVIVQTIISTVTHTFTVSVDEMQSVEELVKAGNFNWSNDNITSKNFPKQKKGQKMEKEIVLFHFDKGMSSDSVISEMDKAGYKPATIWDILGLAIKEPDLQRSFPIVALGSVCRRDGSRYVADLCEDDSGRRLDLYYFDYGWRDYCRFAGVRKS